MRDIYSTFNLQPWRKDSRRKMYRYSLIAWVIFISAHAASLSIMLHTQIILHNKKAALLTLEALNNKKNAPFFVFMNHAEKQIKKDTAMERSNKQKLGMLLQITQKAGQHVALRTITIDDTQAIVIGQCEKTTVLSTYIKKIARVYPIKKITFQQKTKNNLSFKVIL